VLQNASGRSHDVGPRGDSVAFLSRGNLHTYGRLGAGSSPRYQPPPPDAPMRGPPPPTCGGGLVIGVQIFSGLVIGGQMSALGWKGVHTVCTLPRRPRAAYGCGGVRPWLVDVGAWGEWGREPICIQRTHSIQREGILSVEREPVCTYVRCQCVCVRLECVCVTLECVYALNVRVLSLNVCETTPWMCVSSLNVCVECVCVTLECALSMCVCKASMCVCTPLMCAYPFNVSVYVCV
jgi:hypothetical protein